MPRVARMVVPGLAHHITQRGNNRQDVFFADDDRRVYLSLLKEQAEGHGLRVLAYCVMSNHVHLVVVPPRARLSPRPSAGRTLATASTSTGCTGGAGICGRTGSSPAPWTRCTCGGP